MVDQIIAALKQLEPIQKVYYGTIPTKIDLDVYDYAVVFKAKTQYGESSRKKRYQIAIVMEDIIDEDLVDQAIAKCTSLGLKFDKDTGIDYDYSMKPDTSTALEAAVFTVYKTVRVC